jgi:hypothetical protein
MMGQTGDTSGLSVELHVPETAVLGLPVLAALSVRNLGQSALNVSTRLNLMEGDVRLSVNDPTGKRRVVTGAGGQPDTALRQVTLPPARQLVAGINLFYTDGGDTFREAGRYVLQAEYLASPQTGWVASAPVPISVQQPLSHADAGVADLLKREDAKLAVTLAEADRAPDELKGLAERFPDTLAGKLARLILTGSGGTARGAVASDEFFLTTNPITTALLITLVSTPYSKVGRRLTEQYTVYIEPQDTAVKTLAQGGASEKERALQIIKGQPVEIDKNISDYLTALP